MLKDSAASNAAGLGLHPWPGTRSHVPQLMILHGAQKILQSQTMHPLQAGQDTQMNVRQSKYNVVWQKLKKEVMGKESR